MFTVATINLLGYQARPEERWPLIVAGLAREAPDLVALQEVSASHQVGTRLASALNAETVRIGSGRHYEYVQQTNLRNHELSVGILTGYPVLAQAWVDLRGQGRVALGIATEIAGARVGFVSTHLFWEPGAAGDPARRYQAEVLLDWVACTFAGAVTVVGGDFNATPDSGTYACLTERWTSLYAAHHGAEPAWTAPTPVLPAPDGWQGTLDYLFRAPRDASLHVVDSWLGLNAPSPDDPGLYPSDHLAVCARVVAQRP